MTSSWSYLKNTDTVKILEIGDNGWNIFSAPRPVRSGGGIGVLFRDVVRNKLSPLIAKFQSFQFTRGYHWRKRRFGPVVQRVQTTVNGKARFTEAMFLEEFSGTAFA